MWEEFTYLDISIFLGKTFTSIHTGKKTKEILLNALKEKGEEI